MKKRKLLFNGLLGVFAFITMIISLITLNTSVSNFGVADFTPYAITLSKDKNKIETSLSTKDTLSTSVTTELGNDLEVYSELVSNNPYGWQTFMDNGLFEIKEAVHGITKLEMDRAVQSNLTIYYSIDGTRWEEKVIEDTDDTFISETFADYLPNYLKITFNTQTMITSAKIEYTCTEHYFDVTVTSEDETKGTVTGGGTYKIGTEVTLTATELGDYVFAGWFDASDTLISIYNPYTLVMPESNLTYVAKFMEPVTKGSIYEFGKYPQTEVTDAGLKGTLTTLAGELPTPEDPKRWTDYNYVVDSVVTSFMWHIDINFEGVKYRGVYFIENRPNLCHSPVGYDNYQEKNGYLKSNGIDVINIYWFKFEPIKWRVLDVIGPKALLHSDISLDSQPFYDTTDGWYRTINGMTIQSNNYEYSSIRPFLNNKFYTDAFSASEQDMINTTLIDNSMESTLNMATDEMICRDTYDKVFLLSRKEVYDSNYGFDTISRQRGYSEYSLSQGIYQDRTTNWLLRSPQTSSYLTYGIANVGGSGDASDKMGTNPGTNYMGVVPAIWANIVPPKVGDTLEFGMYPQSKVTDDALITNLNSLAGALPTETDKWTWIDYEYIALRNVESFMFYQDITLGESKYRGVYFTKYRPNDTRGPLEATSSNQDENGYDINTTYWFKFEPLIWRIHRVEDNKLFLVSDKQIDAQAFFYTDTYRTIDGETIYPSNYEHSDIRTWLNNDFYNTSFGATEQSSIVFTNVDNSLTSTTYDACDYLSNNTVDKVFLLSREEASDSTFNLETLLKSATDYAICQGLVTYNEHYMQPWRLRTPQQDKPYANGIVQINTYLNTYDVIGYNVESTRVENGIVPAMWVTL